MIKLIDSIEIIYFIMKPSILKALLMLNLGLLPSLSWSETDANLAPQRGQGITDLSRDLYQPLGILFHGFKINPRIESENQWKDNIYSTQNNSRSDFVFHLKPNLEIKSQWNRHRLNLSISTDAMFYSTYHREDKQNTFLDLFGKYDILKRSFLFGRFYYKDIREDRGTPDSQTRFLAAHPLENETIGGIIGYNHFWNRFELTATYEGQHIDYIDGLDGVGLPLVNPNHERSRLVHAADLRLAYQLFSNYQAYLKGGYNRVDYDNIFVSQNNLDRSSDGYTLFSGIKIDLGSKLTADGYVGYLSQNYYSTRLKDIQGITGGLLFQWMPSSLTTVKLGVNRLVNETTQDRLSGFFSTAVTTNIDHELKRNILLNFHAGYTDNDYRGLLAINRQEDNYNVGFNVKYLFNRNLYLKASYDYDGRAVNRYSDFGAGSDYDINNFLLTIGGQL
jgi:hypothetical protein